MSDDNRPEPKKRADWEAVEIDYRAGIMSFEEMAKKHGTTKGRISQVAKEKEWPRDLAAKIKAKADAKLNKLALNNSLNAERKTFRESEVVEAGANLRVNIEVSQRKDIGRSRTLVMSLLTELEESTNNIELFRDLGEMMRRPDSSGSDKLNDLYNKVISLGTRSTVMKSLADSLKTLVTLEREAYGIKTDEGEDKGATVVQIVRYSDAQ